MPYITQERREEYFVSLDLVLARFLECDERDMPGELNYIISFLAWHFINVAGEKYRHYNAIIGALECCKQELYRRHVGPYEDAALERNGDV